MRLTGALALLLAVATASPVAVADIGSKDVKEINGLPVVSVEALQSLKARDALITKDVIDAGKDDVPVENSLEARVWPASHQSNHFRAVNGGANRVKTRIIVGGVHLVVTAWFSDIRTMFVQFEPDFPSAKAPNFLMAGLEDLATGFLRQPWRIAWDSIYSLCSLLGAVRPCSLTIGLSCGGTEPIIRMSTLDRAEAPMHFIRLPRRRHRSWFYMHHRAGDEGADNVRRLALEMKCHVDKASSKPETKKPNTDAKLIATLRANGIREVSGACKAYSCEAHRTAPTNQKIVSTVTQNPVEQEDEEHLRLIGFARCSEQYPAHPYLHPISITFGASLDSVINAGLLSACVHHKEMSLVQEPSQQQGLGAVLRPPPGPISSNLAPYGSMRYPAVSHLPGAVADTHDENLVSQWWSDPAKDAYDNAIGILRKELTDEEYQQLRIQSQHSMKDVQSAVESAQLEYQKKSKSSKIQSALTTCSSRIMFYGGWGALKFLFVAVLNHEELLVEISRAVSQIASVLPRTELHSVLYPTTRMQQAVSQLYAKIIEFALMAIKWYRKGKLSHTFTAIIKPFSLWFKPIVVEIAERSRHVDELANAAAKAEIRDQHAEIRDLHAEIRDLRVDTHIQNEAIARLSNMVSLMQQQQSLQTVSLFAMKEEQVKRFRASQLEGIRTVALLEDTAVADESLAWCRSMRNRRRQKAPTQLPQSELHKLKAWASDPSSSLLLAEGQGVKTSSLDFAADFLDIVLQHGYPVIWALSSIVSDVYDDDSLAESATGIIRSLISQALALDDAAVSEGVHPLTPKHFKSAVSILQWFDIFERCVSNFQRLFVVLDMNAIESALEQREAVDQGFNVREFIERISHISQSAGGSIKVIIASWRFGANNSMEAGSIFDERHLFTDRGRKIERLMKQPRFRDREVLGYLALFCVLVFCWYAQTWAMSSSPDTPGPSTGRWFDQDRPATASAEGYSTPSEGRSTPVEGYSTPDGYESGSGIDAGERRQEATQDVPDLFISSTISRDDTLSRARQQQEIGIQLRNHTLTWCPAADTAATWAKHSAHADAS
ncbi:hypothetical protein CSIM01_03806 [Colletotrichum simmondsii]|uniref:DUF7708 domain-containing protein n=1 Tax=Colletotrichum simmondsii TaxID=703756 RepID=A0A135TMW2_9PEZI|nr:hypothetical protein CSIM01_03806 [Colletotrichum simmondsii]